MKKVQKATEFNQEAWLKPYIDTELSKKSENDFEKYFSKSMNSAVFEKQ